MSFSQESFIISLCEIRPTSAYADMYILMYIINSVASYMFRPPIVAIFREVFFEGYSK
jgi:hypothetical protein